MRIKVIFAVFLLALTYTLNANETQQSDSINSQKEQDTVKAAALSLKAKIDLLTLLLSETKDFQLSDTSNIVQIRENTKETADNTKKDGYDKWGIVLSALAFLTAGITLVFTVRTYKSQKKTQKNTIPKANKKIQRYLLNDLIIRLFEGHMRLTALWYLLNEKNYQYYPSEQILRKTKLPSDTIFTYLFYTEDDEKGGNIDKNQVDDYQIVQGFSEMLEDYNMSIEELEMHLKEKNIPQDLFYLEFTRLLDKNDKIATAWGKVMTILFLYTNEMKSAIFESFIENNVKEDTDEQKTSAAKGFYKPNEVCSDYLIHEEKKRQLLAYMEKQTALYKKIFEKYLIERK